MCIRDSNVEAWDRALASTAAIFRSCAERGISLAMVNLGGGFPAKYIRKTPRLESYGKAIFKSLRKHFGNNLPNTIVEPGRGLVGNAGVIEAEVVLIAKRSPEDEVRWVDVYKRQSEASLEGCRPGPCILRGPRCARAPQDDGNGAKDDVMNDTNKPVGYGHDKKGAAGGAAYGDGKPGVAHTAPADKPAGKGEARTAKTFTIDDREIDIREGETIFNAARRLDIKLPHLCYSPQPGYRPDGNCRVCMVEIEGERVLAASCIRSPSPGMKVKTQTDRAKTARKMVAELLLTDQPAMDVAHDPDSELWKTVTRLKVEPGRFPKRKAAEVPEPDRSHVAMAVNLDACIQCNLCVRACREVQVNDVIGMAGRGHLEKIVFDFDDPMGASTCVACGECVQACPTGALMPATMVDESNVYKGKPDRTVDSVCPYCGVGCQLTYQIKGDKIAAVTGRNGPANESRLCVKGRFGFDYVHNPQRLLKPMIRKDGVPKRCV